LEAVAYGAMDYVNTPHFPITQRDVFIAAIPTGLQISNKKQGGALNFKGISQDGGRVKLAENLPASPFNEDLSSVE
jgi:hypothetical protein